MKTIATAAILMMLTASAWADDAEKQTNDPANTNEPIVLSETEMDSVTAGMRIRPLHDRVLVRRIEEDESIGTYTFQY